MQQRFLTTAVATLLLVVLQTCFNNAQAATIYTKGGQAVEVSHLNELTSEQLAYITQYFVNTYPKATKLANASAKYNCHSYAWNLSDGGSDTCWINQYDSNGNQNIAKYWTNDHYSETTEAKAVKVFYYMENSDHSAIASSSVSGTYESKWGRGPLMRHNPEYGPYSDMDKRRYFAPKDTATITIPSVYYGMISCSLGTRALKVGEAANYTVTNYNSGAFIFEYAVETPKGDDVIEPGYAVVNSVLYNGINVTFTRKGLYEMYFRFYDKKTKYLVAEFTYEPVIE